MTEAVDARKLGEVKLAGSKRILAAGAALSVSLAAPGHAVMLTWTLSNVTFNDGGTASGYFTYDADTNTFGALDIVTTNGSALTGFEYNAQWSASHDGVNQYTFYPVWNRYIRFHTESALSDAGGSIGLITGDYHSYECANCIPERGIVSGSLVATGVPEPATWGMILLGFAGIGVGIRARRKVRVAFG